MSNLLKFKTTKLILLDSLLQEISSTSSQYSIVSQDISKCEMARGRKGRGSTGQPDSGPNKYKQRKRSQYKNPDTRSISPAENEGKVGTIEFDPLMCEFCALNFDLIDEFIIHIEEPHSHSCTLAEDCDLSFTSGLQLRDHIREVHPINILGGGEDSEGQTQVAREEWGDSEGQAQDAREGGGDSEGQAQVAREEGGYQADPNDGTQSLADDSQDDHRICQNCFLQVNKLKAKFERKIFLELDIENNETIRGHPDEIPLDDYIICQKCTPMIKTFANNIERRVLQLLSE